MERPPGVTLSGSPCLAPAGRQQRPCEVTLSTAARTSPTGGPPLAADRLGQRTPRRGPPQGPLAARLTGRPCTSGRPSPRRRGDRRSHTQDLVR